jgi:hypothetical protein
MSDISKNDYLDIEARALFQKLIKTSKRYSSLLEKILAWENNILDFNLLMSLVPAPSVSSGKIQNVKTSKIIGT